MESKTTFSHQISSDCYVSDCFDGYRVERGPAEAAHRLLQNIVFRCHIYIAGRIAYALFVGLMVILCLGGGEAQANDSEPIYTLEECIEIGTERSVSLANARRDAEIAESRISQVKSQLFPSLDIESSYTRLDERPELSETSLGLLDNYSVTAGAKQLIYSGGSVSAGIKAAESYRAYAQDGINQQSRALIRDIRIQFYELLYAKARVDVAEASLQQLVELEKQAQQKFDVGTSSEFDLLSAQVKVANEKPQVVAARNALAVTKETFRKLLFLENTAFDISGELDFRELDISVDQCMERALAFRPELSQLHNIVSMRKMDVRSARGSYFPSIFAFGNYTGSNPSSESMADDEWKWHWNAGLLLSWDIMDGGLRRSQIREKVLYLAKSEAEYTDLVNTITLQLKTAYLTLMNSREIVLSAEENVHLATKALSIADVRYKKGLATYLENTDANLALSSARLTQLAANRSYFQSVAELKYACGTDDIENN
ncbi:MAG: TolC family protein [Spartobacteria bacterium]|nr:TolC family protein [Spartobacteria bacterium]